MVKSGLEAWAQYHHRVRLWRSQRKRKYILHVGRNVNYWATGCIVRDHIFQRITLTITLIPHALPEFAAPHPEVESISPLLEIGHAFVTNSVLSFGGSDVMWFPKPSYERRCSFCLALSQHTFLLNPVTRHEAQITYIGSGEEEKRPPVLNSDWAPSLQLVLVMMWVSHLGLWSSCPQLSCHIWYHTEQRRAFSIKP